MKTQLESIQGLSDDYLGASCDLLHLEDMSYLSDEKLETTEILGSHQPVASKRSAVETIPLGGNVKISLLC